MAYYVSLYSMYIEKMRRFVVAVVMKNYFVVLSAGSPLAAVELCGLIAKASMCRKGSPLHTTKPIFVSVSIVPAQNKHGSSPGEK